MKSRSRGGAVIAKKMLGSCRRCETPLSYNIYQHPYCDRCDCVVVASRCYHCGTAVHPVYEEETVELSGFVHRLWNWNCPACGEWRVDFEHQEMGSGTSGRPLARLKRLAEHVRFAVPYYAERLFLWARPRKIG
jgi:hypothetical protein